MLRRVLALFMAGRFASSRSSQGKQASKLLQIFATIGTTNKFYAEFGFNANSLEGGSGANSYALWNRGWQGLFLDGSHGNASINLHKTFIKSTTIVATFDKFSVPKELDYLSVDIDSADLWVLKSILSTYRPRVITIEYNSNYGYHPGTITFPDPQVMPILHGKDTWEPPSCYMGASASAIMSLVAKEHGYKLVDVEPALDLFFVRGDVAKGSTIETLDPRVEVLPIQQWHGKLSTQEAENLIDYQTYMRTHSVCQARQSAARYLIGLAHMYQKWSPVSGKHPQKRSPYYCFSGLLNLRIQNCSTTEAEQVVPSNRIGVCQNTHCMKKRKNKGKLTAH